MFGKVQAPLPAIRKPRAAQYLRMSTEHQRYSLEFQASIIAGYARARGYEVERTYVDAAVSGLGIKRREGLRSLLADVVSGEADFEIVLVYDVSRWGRFQDPDQSAHYEFVCREAGVQVEYCAEPFVNDRSLAGSLVKQLKRAMAAEYSRELSTRTSKAQRSLAAKGYWVGGPAPYGLRRLLVGPDGTRRLVLETGEHKLLQSGRTILVAGPAEEVATVVRIFQMAARDRLRPLEIVGELNAEGLSPGRRARWTGDQIRKLLRDPVYVGVNTIGKTFRHLGPPVRFAPAAWLRVEGAFEPLVSGELFRAAGRRLRRVGVTDQDMIEDLRRLWKHHGRLSQRIIAQDPDARSPATYQARFGTLMRAYELAGCRPSDRQRVASERIRHTQPHRYRPPPESYSDDELLRRLSDLLEAFGYLNADLISEQPGPSRELYAKRFGGMRRVYALVGYVPNAYQENTMDRQGGQTIDREEARRIREGLSVR